MKTLVNKQYVLVIILFVQGEIGELGYRGFPGQDGIAVSLIV